MDKLQPQSANGVNLTLKLLNNHLMQYNKLNQIPNISNNVAPASKLENQLLALAGQIKSREKGTPPQNMMSTNTIFQNVVKAP